MLTDSLTPDRLVRPHVAGMLRMKGYAPVLVSTIKDVLIPASRKCFEDGATPMEDDQLTCLALVLEPLMDNSEIQRFVPTIN